MQQKKQMNLFLLSAVLYLSSDVTAFTIPSSTSNAFTSTSSTFRPATTSNPSTLMMSMGMGDRLSKWSSRKSNQVSSKQNSLFPETSKSSHRFNLLSKLKRTIAIFLTSTFLLLGPIQLNHQNQLSIQPPAAHASSIASTTGTITPKSKASLDKIINEYVQQNMFNDDIYDPVESTYRETIADSSTGAYPSTVSSAAQSVLGKKLPQPTRSTSDSGDGQSIKFVLRLVDSIHDKLGGKVPKSFIVPALFLVGGGTPIMMALAGLMSFSYNQKAMTERMAVQRYGESVLDAEERKVTDDDDDDDDENGNGDDDDSDDDDDDDDDSDDEDE